MIRRLLGLMIAFGLLGVVIFGVYAMIDWAALQDAYTRFATVSAQQQGRSAVSAALFTAESVQNIHRLNLFAEGVWTLLSAILAGVGLLGLRPRSEVGASS